MKNHIENIRVSVKKKGYTPTSDQIRQAINIVCPNGVDILSSKSAIVSETIRLINLSHESTIADTVKTDNKALSTPDTDEIDTTEIIVSVEDKHDLIAVQSSALDVDLSDAETIELCEQIPDVFDDYASFVNTVTGGIKAFIDDKFDKSETQSVNDSIDDLRKHIATRQARLDKKFASGLNEVRGDLEQIRSNIKSRQAAILGRFKITTG
jgi:hypothetical protein